MWKFFAFLFIYVAAIILLIVFKCWITIGIVYALGIILFIYSIKTAEECPEELKDLFE